LLERVRVRGYDGSIFIVSIDEEAEEVNLVAVSGVGRSLNAIPFLELIRRGGGAADGGS
jgi:hypothetical protein